MFLLPVLKKSKQARTQTHTRLLLLLKLKEKLLYCFPSSLPWWVQVLIGLFLYFDHHGFLTHSSFHCPHPFTHHPVFFFLIFLHHFSYSCFFLLSFPVSPQLRPFACLLIFTDAFFLFHQPLFSPPQNLQSLLSFSALFLISLIFITSFSPPHLS